VHLVRRAFLAIPKVLLMTVQKSADERNAALLLPTGVVGTATFNRSTNSH
jgi:hypothetical protein